MEIGSTGQMTQTQMRSMDGSGKGQHGNGGMKDIMQSLSQEDKMVLKDKMSALSAEDRKVAMDSMKEVDKTDLNSSDYLSELLAILDTSSTDETEQTEQITEVYA